MTAEQEQPALVCTMENIKVEGYNGLTDDAASWVTGSLTLTLLDPAITTKIHITSLKVQLKGACAAKLFLSGNNEEDITLTDYTHLKQSKTLVSPDRGIILKLNALNHTTRSVPFRIPISSQEGGAVYCAPPPSIETVTKDCAYQVEIKVNTLSSSIHNPLPSIHLILPFSSSYSMK